MSEPFLGEIKLVSFNFPPRGWALCNGQLLAINQNQALFSIMGTQYGGNGTTTFALPNLQGRIPIHPGNGFAIGQSGGEVSHSLTQNEIPAHNHPARAQSSANTGSAAGAVWAAGSTAQFTGTATTAMNSAAVASTGANQPHENRAPYLALNFVVALTGIFPSRNG